MSKKLPVKTPKNIYEKIFVLFNIDAGQSLFTSNWSKVRSLVQGLRRQYPSAQVRMVGVDNFADVSVQAKLACDLKTQLLVIAGGDGTIRAVAEVVYKSKHQPQLSIFPAGTTNLIANEMNLPTNIDEWLEKLTMGQPQEIYPLNINGKLFVAVAGVGFDSYVVSRVSSEEKAQLGKAAYMSKVGQVLTKDWQEKFQVLIDDQPVAEDVYSVLVLHGKYYAGMHEIIPEARLSDDFFYVVTFDNVISKNIMRYALQLVTGGLRDNPAVRVYKALDVKIAGASDFPVQADGDLMGKLPVHISLVDKPLVFIL